LSRKNAHSGASLALVALLCSAAAAVRAGETTQITTNLTVEQDWDSNVFYKEKDPNSSALTIVRPALTIENHGTLGHFIVNGWVSDHTFWDEHDLDGTDRGVGGDLDRQLLPRLWIFGSGSYQRIQAHDEIRGPTQVSIGGESPGVPGQPVITPGQLVEGAVPTLDLGQGQLGLRYLLSPLNKLSLSGGPYTITYLPTPSVPPSDLRDRNGWFANLTLDHTLDPLDTLSFSIDANSTEFADTELNPFTVADPSNPHTVPLTTGTTDSDLQSFTVSWGRSWSELWSTNVALGVRRLETQNMGQPQVITRVAPNPAAGTVTPFVDITTASSDDVGPGLIGALSLQRTLSRGNVVLSYSRETRTTSSVATSNVNVDTVSLQYHWRLAEYVTFTAYGAYEHFTSANHFPEIQPATYVADSFNPITGPEFTCAQGSLVETGSGADKGGQCELSAHNRLQSNLWNTWARIDWQLQKRLATFVVLRFNDRSGDPALFGNPYDKWNVGVGFHYDYDFTY